jgi:hypothetical protein
VQHVAREGAEQRDVGVREGRRGRPQDHESEIVALKVFPDGGVRLLEMLRDGKANVTQVLLQDPLSGARLAPRSLRLRKRQLV